MRIIFFDTETTGNDEEDRLCQLSVKDRGVAEPVVNELYKPPLPIAFEAMAVHHITEKMVVNKPTFQAADEFGEIEALFENTDTIAVAHNVAFDMKMLRNEGVSVARPLCTLKLVRALDTDGVFSNYKLQYLRYKLGIDIEDAVAHDAWGDVLVLEQLFERLLLKYVEMYGSEEKAIEKMLEISTQPSLLRTIPFGKHAGKKLDELVQIDPEYLEWLLREKRKNPEGEEDWIYTLEKVLGK